MTAIASFKQFYPFYKSQHQKTGTRVLHVLGTSLFLGSAAYAVVAREAAAVPAGIVCAYGCAWVGHFFMEKNRPATFKYPVWSLMADFVMLFNILTGREPLIIT